MAAAQPVNRLNKANTPEVVNANQPTLNMGISRGEDTMWCDDYPACYAKVCSSSISDHRTLIVPVPVGYQQKT